MMKKILILILSLYILTLFQTSFFVHFNIFSKIPNLILILIIFINLFERPENPLGLYSSAIAGFFLDIFSTGFKGINFFGFHILILLAISIFLKMILRKYVRISIGKRA